MSDEIKPGVYKTELSAEQIRALCEAVEKIEDEWGTESSVARALRPLADRVSALLPPADFTLSISRLGEVGPGERR